MPDPADRRPLTEGATAPSGAAAVDPAPLGAAPVDAAAVAASFERLSAIFADMMTTVEQVSRYRCPYKNRLGRCTAQFGCRNQRRPPEPGGLRVCGGDDKLDYRSAWESR